MLISYKVNFKARFVTWNKESYKEDSGSHATSSKQTMLSFIWKTQQIKKKEITLNHKDKVPLKTRRQLGMVTREK
jgi:hypothetical protein